MKTVTIILVLAGVLAIAGGAVAPGVCTTLQASLTAVIAFVSDPQPDLLIGPGGFVDGMLTC